LAIALYFATRRKIEKKRDRALAGMAQFSISLKIM